MATAAALESGELVVEVGPGLGALTETLLSSGGRILALEADGRAIASLENKFAAALKTGQLTLSHTDVRELDLSRLPLTDHGYKVVANIPYYLSGFLFRKFLDSSIQPNKLVFLVQKEVAKRIAKAPKESLLSLSVKAFGTPSYIADVPREHFYPEPKVDSAIIAVADINRKAFTQVTSEAYFNLLHLSFGSKRKQLGGTLARYYTKQRLLEVFAELNLPPTVRAEDVPAQVWLQLANKLKGKLKNFRQ